MNWPLLMTMLAGFLVLWSSGCVGLLEILSNPCQVNYPTAKLRARAAMFVWAVALAYRGLEMMAFATDPIPRYATGGAIFGSIALAVVQTALLEHHLRSWLPAATQARVKQLIDIASCRSGRVVVKGLSSRVEA